MLTCYWITSKLKKQLTYDPSKIGFSLSYILSLTDDTEETMKNHESQLRLKLSSKALSCMMKSQYRYGFLFLFRIYIKFDRCLRFYDEKLNFKSYKTDFNTHPHRGENFIKQRWGIESHQNPHFLPLCFSSSSLWKTKVHHQIRVKIRNRERRCFPYDF